MIQITKEERAIIHAAHPELRVPRTKHNIYYLCEEEKYLRLIPQNESAAKILRAIDRRKLVARDSE